MTVYRRTGDRRYLETIPYALDYLKRSELPDGQLARFFELRTNRPLYFTRQYRLTYDDSDLPTHYAFKICSRVDELSRAYAKLANTPGDRLGPCSIPRKVDDQLKREVSRVINATDARGAWVTDIGMRYHRKQGSVIDMGVTVHNLNTLADYLSAD